MNEFLIVLLTAIALSFAGCARYIPQPLTTDLVDRALTLPTTQELSARIARLHNPLIRQSAYDPEDGLSPNSAAVIAVVLNPALIAERNRSQIADAQLLEAGILPNPTLSYNLDVPFGANSAGQVSGYGVGLQWEITSLITHDAKVEAAKAAEQQIRLDVAWKEWQVAQAARQAVYDVLVWRSIEADSSRLVDQLNRIAQATQRAVAAHDLTANQGSAVDAAKDEACTSLAAARRDRLDAELALNRALGFPAAVPVRLEPHLQLPSTVPVYDAATLEGNLENRRIDLAALRRGYDSQESSVRAAVLGQFPKISLGLSHTRDYGDFLTLGPAVTADLPFFDRNQGNIAIAYATRQQLRDEYVARVFEARADIARFVALIVSLNRLIAEEAREVRSLQRMLDLNEEALSHGNLDTATFYPAAVSLAQKRADLTKLKADLVHATINLELAAGATLFDAAYQSPTTGEAQ